MIQSKVKNTFKEIGINFPINSSSECINILICDNIENYKKALKNALKLYKSFKFDTLLFKIEFDYKEDNINNLENSITILNRFIDICKLKKPNFMKKTLYTNENNILKEIIVFYWDLSKEKIKIKTLIKEILFLNNDGFKELFSSVYFLDTKKHILFSFYDDKTIKIFTKNNLDKLLKKYKKFIM